MPTEKNNFVNDGFLEYLYVLDSTYTKKMIIDQFIDFLWTERYRGYGEFELTVPVRKDIVQNCRLNDYIAIKESDVFMIVETIGVHTDVERGDTLVISGRSLESILDRRIIWGVFKETPYNKQVNLQQAIKKMIDENVISPSDNERAIPNFSFKESDDERIISITKEAIESDHGNIYDEIDALCEDQELGFRVNAKGAGGFEFELYFGTDRTWDQNAVPPVVFSESYENLRNSNYLQSEKEYRSTLCIGGENVGDSEVWRKEKRVGLARRELYTSDTSVTTKEALVEKAKEILADYKVTKLFEGETVPNRQFAYGVDYFLGDVVQLENKYGQKGKCRVTEVVKSRNASGPSLIPTFEAIEEDEDEEGSD